MAVFVVVLLWALAYLLGSFPTGYLVARWIKGIDIRQHGSGGTGATNVLRNRRQSSRDLGPLVDLLKGMAAVGAGAAGVPHGAGNVFGWTSHPGLAILGRSRGWFDGHCRP